MALAGEDRTATPPSTRERLLAAARSLFSEKGFAATSTREIAARAGCNIALIKHYFGSKEGLLKETFTEGLTAAGDELRALAMSDLPVEQKLQRFIDFMVDHIDRNRNGICIVHRELVQSNSPLLASLKPLIAANVELLMSILKSARAEGRLREVDPRVAGPLLMGMLQFYFLAYPLASQIVGPRSPDVLASLKRHIGQIFIGGVIKEKA